MNRRQLYAAVISLLAFVVFANVANGQSKDRDNPTQLTSGEISGLIDSDTKGNVYYYSFTVNPGEVVITLSVESNPPITTYAPSSLAPKVTLWSDFMVNFQTLWSEPVLISKLLKLGSMPNS